MGHISPLIGIFLELNKQYDFIYFGLEGGMEEEICKKYNIKFHSMKLLPFYRKNIFKNIKTFYFILKEKKRIRKIYSSYDVKSIICSGGFVSIPLILGLKNSNKILLESNTSLGLANKVLSFFINKIGVQFNTIKNKKSVVIGNPIVIEEASFDHPLFYKDINIILFVGGSNGALEIVELAYKFNIKYPDAKIFVITGEKYYESFKFNNNAYVYKKIFKLSSILNKFKLVVSRAGAATITELLLSNTDFILVPSYYVSGNHQYKNAKYLYDKGMCGIITDPKEEKNTSYIYDFFINKECNLLVLNNKKDIVIKDSVKLLTKLIDN